MNIEWQKMDNDRKSDLNHVALDAVKNVDTSNMKSLKINKNSIYYNDVF